MSGRRNRGEGRRGRNQGRRGRKQGRLKDKAQARTEARS